MKQSLSHQHPMDIVKIGGTFALTGLVSFAGQALLTAPAIALSLQNLSPNVRVTDAGTTSTLGELSSTKITFEDDVIFDLLHVSTDSSSAFVIDDLQPIFINPVVLDSFSDDEVKYSMMTVIAHSLSPYSLPPHSLGHAIALAEPDLFCDRQILQQDIDLELCHQIDINPASASSTVIHGDRRDLTPTQQNYSHQWPPYKQQAVKVPPQRQGKVAYSYYQDHGIFWLDADAPVPPGARPITQ